MGERSGFDEGIFCWTDLGTTDAEGAKAFYGGLFGWEFEDMPVGEEFVYSMARLGGKHVAAVYAQTQEGAPPSWLSYVSVADADAAAAKAKELGGSAVSEPMDVLAVGRQAVLADPQGAVFAVWQAGRHKGAEVVNDPGTLTWNQLNTSDLDAAEDFYTQLFGWKADTIESGDQRYTMWIKGATRNGGSMSLPPGNPAPPHWLPYFTHEQLEDATAQIGTLGGTVVVGPMEIPAGRFLVGQDPQGAFFALFEGEVDP